MRSAPCRACWLALLALAACPAGPGNWSQSDPPVVTVTTPQPTTVGQNYHLTIQISGCDRLQKVDLYDNQTFLQTTAFAANPIDVDVPANRIPYRSGVAANPLFLAKAYCADGRVGTSPPAPGKFFPVEKVIQAAGGAPTVPDSFIAQGKGGSAVFIGCDVDQSGTGQLVVVDTNAVVGFQRTPAVPACTADASFTDRNLATGTRWMMVPGAGYLEFDDTLTVKTSMAANAMALGVAPDGDAIVYNGGIIGNGGGLFRIHHASGSTDFTRAAWQYAPLGAVISNIVVDHIGNVVLTTWNETAGPSLAAITIERVNYWTGTAAGIYQIRGYPVPIGGISAPQARLSSSGTVLFFPVSVAPGQSKVEACATITPNCTNVRGADGQPPGLVWESGLLTGDIAVAQPYADDSRIAAISPTHAWFLDGASGGVQTGDGQAVLPEGALQYMAYQAGLGRDFYLLSGSGVPTEVVAVESAEAGVAYRFSMNNGSLSVAVDDEGRAWLRIATKLVKPYRMVEYRQAMTN